jgi:REP element-mobilizing transposase RayT
MPGRKELLVVGETYHLFNRTIVNESIFSRKKELSRALSLINFYRFPQGLRYSKFLELPPGIEKEYLLKIKKQEPLVKIYAFAFMPNHFHFLLKQIGGDGIRKFISNFQNSFAKYFNKKNHREGNLFNRPFKSKRISTEEEFTHVSRYIHLNPVTSYLLEYEKLATYPYTSYPNYISVDVEKNGGDLIDTESLITIFGSRKKYESFVANQIDYQRKLHLIKGLILEHY